MCAVRERAHRWDALPPRGVAALRKWGSPALLLSWLPVLGDPLCFAAGFLRLPFLASLLFITLGKVTRYGVILLVLT